MRVRGLLGFFFFFSASASKQLRYRRSVMSMLTFVLSLWVAWIRADGCLQTIPRTSLDQIEGSSVTLSCGSSCASLVVWYLNGSNVTGMSQQPYQTVYLDPTRAGMYECAAMLPNGTLVGRTWVANITVESIFAPADQYALIGESANLNCSVTRSSAQIYWFSFEDPSVNGSSSVSIGAVGVGDDHPFICSVVLYMSTVLRKVYLHVLALPTIQSGPPAVVEIISNVPNSAGSVPVFFRSRPANTTTISWYKDGNSLLGAANITATLGALDGNTSLTFPRVMTREDGGVYTVVIRNSFSAIPLSLRTCNISFTLRVKVLPVTPVDVMVSTVDPSHVTVTWSLYPQFPDEDASTFTVELLRPNGDLVSTLDVGGDARMAKLVVMPGTDYGLKLTATNMDGYVTTQSIPFSTLLEVSGAVIYRLNFTMFLLTINFSSYNGGVDVRDVNISYRVAGGGIPWGPALVVPVIKSSAFSVRAFIEVVKGVAGAGRVEFNMSALNTLPLETSPLVFTERVDLPGPPRLSIAKDSTNLTILVQLSEVGSPPLIQVVLVVTTLNDHWLLTMSGSYLPGDCVPFTLSVLANDGDYMFAAYAVNFAGQGPSSPQTTYPDSMWAPLWVIMTSVLGALILFALVLMISLGCVRCLAVKQKRYAISDDSISTSIRMYPPQSSKHVVQPSPDYSDTKPFVASISTPSDTSPTDRSMQPQCHQCFITCPMEVGLTDESFSGLHSSQRVSSYATYV